MIYLAGGKEIWKELAEVIWKQVNLSMLWRLSTAVLGILCDGVFRRRDARARHVGEKDEGCIPTGEPKRTSKAVYRVPKSVRRLALEQNQR